MQLEPLLAQRAIDPPERPLGPGLAEDVDIMGDMDFGCPVLQGVDLDHQAADEDPLTWQPRDELADGRP